MTHKELLNIIIKNGEIVQLTNSKYEIVNFWEIYNQTYNDVDNHTIYDIYGYHVMLGKVYFYKFDKECDYRQLHVQHLSFDKDSKEYIDGEYQLYDIFEYKQIRNIIGTKDEFFKSLEERKQYLISKYNLENNTILRLKRSHDLKLCWTELNDGIFIPDNVIINYKYNQIEVEGKLIYLTCGSLTCDPYYVTCSDKFFTNKNMASNFYIISEFEKEEIMKIWETWKGKCRYWDGYYNFSKRIDK